MLIDLDSPSVRANPYPAYARIRAAGRVVADRTRKTFYVGHYCDVLDVLRDSKRFSNLRTGKESTLMGADGTVHREARGLLQPLFAPTQLEQLMPRMRNSAMVAIRRAGETRNCEFVSAIAGMVPKSILADMMGDSEDRIAHYRDWADGIIASDRLPHGHSFKPGWGQRLTALTSYTARKRLKHNQARQACRDHLNVHLFDDKRSSKRWIAEVLASTQARERFSEEQLIDIGMVFIVAATETTTSLIATAGYLLASRPELQRRLRDDLDLVDPFIEEVLRYDSPVQHRPRYTLTEARIGETVIPAGRTVMALVGSANHDPAQFDRPDEFRLDRSPNRHLSFGAGPHFCLGSELARMETRAILHALLTTLPEFRLNDPQQPIQHPELLAIRGVRAFDVRFLA